MKTPNQTPICCAADLLILAHAQWGQGNLRDALILCAGAMAEPSMQPLSESLDITNRAIAEGIPVEQLLQELEETRQNNPPENNGDPSGDNNTALDPNLELTVASVIRAIATDTELNVSLEPDSPDLTDEEVEDDPEVTAGETHTDEDIDGLIDPEDAEIEEEAVDPANIEEMSKHPAEVAADISDEEEEVVIEDAPVNPNDDGPSNFSKKIMNIEGAKLSPESRAAINRLSWSGKSEDRALAKEFASTLRRAS